MAQGQHKPQHAWSHGGNEVGGSQPSHGPQGSGQGYTTAAPHGPPAVYLQQNAGYPPPSYTYDYTTQQYHQHPAMTYQQYGNSGYNYQYPPGYSDPHAQQQQQYQSAPTIRNPFAPPPPAQSTYSQQNAGFDPEQEASIAQWQATYAPQDPLNPKTGAKGDGKTAGAFGPTKEAPQVSEEKKKDYTVMRKGGGKQWEDKSLLEWNPNEFRIQVGNLAGEVTDDSLAKAFDKYGVSKARVIRDKMTTKSKGYGFVSFKDGELGFKAAREMVGKYIGSHPVTIQRSKADLRPTKVKDDHRNKGKNNRNNNNKKGKEEKKAEDPLRANTGAHIEKKPVKNPAGYKMLG